MVNKYTILSSRSGVIVILLLLSLSLTLLVYFSSSSSSSFAQVTESTSSCVTYDSSEKIITITCKSANLTDIDNQLKDPDILHKETTDGTWLLNAGIEVAPNAILYINSTDTSWLKILAAAAAAAAEDGQTAHLIHILGSLKIDSVKLPM